MELSELNSHIYTWSCGGSVYIVYSEDGVQYRQRSKSLQTGHIEQFIFDHLSHEPMHNLNGGL